MLGYGTFASSLTRIFVICHHLNQILKPNCQFQVISGEASFWAALVSGDCCSSGSIGFWRCKTITLYQTAVMDFLESILHLIVHTLLSQPRDFPLFLKHNTLDYVSLSILCHKTNCCPLRIKEMLVTPAGAISAGSMHSLSHPCSPLCHNLHTNREIQRSEYASLSYLPSPAN